MNANRTIAKMLTPALLLTAALSLPAASAADQGRDRDNKQKVVKVEKKQDKVKKVKKVKAGKKVEKSRTEVRTQAVRPAAQRAVVVQRTAPARVYTERRYTEPGYRAGRSVAQAAAAGENSPLFSVEGYVTDEGRRCLALRDHRGKLYTLVGRTAGLEVGDHVALRVRRVLPVYARSCGQGDTVRVAQVGALWAGRNHRNAIFDARRDGEFNPYARERYNRYRGDDDYRGDGRYGDDRYDDRDDRYDDRYDRDDEYGRLISVTGTLGGASDCPNLRDRDGRTYGLSGDLRHYDRGDRVKVIGFSQGGYRCGGPNIQVEEITRP